MKKIMRTMFLPLWLGGMFLLLLGGLTDNHNWGGDFASYIMQARAIVEGTQDEFIESNRFSIEGSSEIKGPVTYPWGLPLLLAPLYAYFGLNILVLKLINVISYLLFLLTLWFGFRKYHSTAWLLILVGFFSLSPLFLSEMNHIRSDIPFLFLSTLSIFFIGKVIIHKDWLTSEVGDHLLLGLVIAFSFFVRTHGILLLMTLGMAQFIKLAQEVLSEKKVLIPDQIGIGEIVQQVIQKCFKNFFTLSLPYGSFMAALGLWKVFFEDASSSTRSYTAQFSSLVSLNGLKANVFHYIEFPAELFSVVPHPSLIYGASIPLAIVGMIRMSGVQYHTIAYISLTSLLLVLWPSTLFRYMYPILPFYVSFTLTGLETSLTASQWKWRTASKVLYMAPLIIILLYFGKSTATHVYRNLEGTLEIPDGPYLPSSKEIFSFISNNIEPDSVIIFHKPRTMAMYTGRPSIHIHKTDRLTDGDYLCLSNLNNPRGQLTQEDLKDLIKDGQLDLVYQNENFKVYRVVKVEA